MRDQDLIRCVYTGQALEPDGNFPAAALADRLGEGEVVFVDLDPQRSAKNHKHQFAFIRTAWMNLPEEMKDAPFAKSPDSLRKHALICCGFCHTDMIALGDNERADRMAEFLRRGDERQEIYTITEVSGPVIYRHIAESQTLKKMGGTRFKESKQAILDFLADMIGVTSEELAVMGKKEAA